MSYNLDCSINGFSVTLLGEGAWNEFLGEIVDLLSLLEEGILLELVLRQVAVVYVSVVGLRRNPKSLIVMYPHYHCCIFYELSS